MKITEWSSTSEKGPLTPEKIKMMLGWETEKEFQARMVASDPTSKPEHWLFGETGPRNSLTGEFQPVHCLDTNKVKVVCWNNANNRPFDMPWSEDLIHTCLRGQWAGPLMMPGETINGETIRVSKYGRVLSGQHQGTACILADEWLQKYRLKPRKPGDPPPVDRLAQFGDGPYPAWEGHDHVVIETIVITGLSEDERVLRTIDYVKPRTTADMLYTMELYRDKTSTERKELTRMLSVGLDFLWTRTDAQGYRTHPEMVGFLERHRRLLKCVEHIFRENNSKGLASPEPCPTCLETGELGGNICWRCKGQKRVTIPGRNISKLRLSVGQASTLCYLMGSSGPKTDGDLYRWGTPPEEKGLDWSYMDKAMEFWSRLAIDRSFMQVRIALGRLVESDANNEDNQGQGGRLPEKLAILAKAWELFREHPPEGGEPFSDADLEPDGLLCLSYNDLDDKGNKLPDGQIKLLDVADFYGIDCPDVVQKPKRGAPPTTPPAGAPPTPEEIEKGKADALARRQKGK